MVSYVVNLLQVCLDVKKKGCEDATWKLSLKPVQVSGPFDYKPEEKIVGNAIFRWQRYCRLSFHCSPVYIMHANEINDVSWSNGLLHKQ